MFISALRYDCIETFAFTTSLWLKRIVLDVEFIPFWQAASKVMMKKKKVTFTNHSCIFQLEIGS